MLLASSIRFPHLGINIEKLPKSITVFGFEIAFYGIIIAIGMVLALTIIFREVKRTNQSEDNYYDLAIFAIIFGIIGARLYYVIFEWDEYKGNLLSILNIRNGGLAIYGGLIAGTITTCIFCKIKKMSIPQVLDTIILGIIIGQILGRWGNFFNREAFGGFTDNIFAMQIRYDEVGGVISDSLQKHVQMVDHVAYIQVHPTFLYESVWNLILFAIMMFLRKRKKFHGEVACTYLIGYGIGRFFIEGLRTDQLTLWRTGIAVSQIVSIVIVLMGISYLLYSKMKLRMIPQDDGKLVHPKTENIEQKNNDK